MAKKEVSEPFILHDRVLLAALCFGSSGYLVLESWVGVALLVAGFMMAGIWAFRTASTHPERWMRLLATLLLVILGAYLTVYVSFTQGMIR